MARVNISLPDDLHEELDQYRDRLNISQVCQETLRRELERLRPLPEDLEITHELIERLRAEKEEYERESRMSGFLAGREWAQRAKFRHLKLWGQREIPPAEKLSQMETPPIELVDWLWEEGELFHDRPERLIESHPELRHLKVVWDFAKGVEGNRVSEFFYFDFGDRAAFNQGFLEAVRSVWQAVKDRV